MYLGTLVGSYSIAIFTPTILRDFGYTAVKAQLYSIPPYVCAVAFSIILAVLADRLQHRCTFLIISISLSITGFAMSGWAIQSTQARYAGIFLAAMGSPPSLPPLVSSSFIPKKNLV
jgi:MFS family permease